MANTYSQMYAHCVWSVKQRQPLIESSNREALEKSYYWTFSKNCCVLVRLRQIFSSLFTLLVSALPPGAKWNQSFAVGENKNVQQYVEKYITGTITKRGQKLIAIYCIT
jgi:hypothetical protein